MQSKANTIQSIIKSAKNDPEFLAEMVKINRATGKTNINETAAKIAKLTNGMRLEEAERALTMAHAIIQKMSVVTYVTSVKNLF